jgi:hypothetical protein
MMRGETAKLLSYCTGTPDTLCLLLGEFVSAAPQKRGSGA